MRTIFGAEVATREALIAATPERRVEIIDSFKTDKGAWTKLALAELGVAWPPKKGWRTRLIKTGRP